MDQAVLARWRMHSQLLWDPVAGGAAGVVGRLAAAQGQDLLPASWGLARRARGTTYDEVRAACDEGAVLRTHVLRPTWHFVAPADLRWLLVATAPRVQQAAAGYNGRLGLDDEVRAGTRRTLAAVLADGQHRTRTELGSALAAAGFHLSGPALAQALMDAELEGVVCSGAARNRQQTYALLDQRAPGSWPGTREEALAELARHYYPTRGPASERDLARWASLPLSEARRATAAVADGLASVDVDGATLWHAPGEPPPPAPPRVDLVHGLDEIVMSYSHTRSVVVGEHGFFSDRPMPFSHLVLVDGRVAGRWAYERDGRGVPVRVLVRPTRDWTTAERDGVAAAAEAFGRFVGDAVQLAQLGPL